MKRAISLLLLLAVTLCCGFAVSESDGYTYVHDPRDNADAMSDIVENPEAVYGFSPDPQSTRLGAYAEYDWTDPVFVEEAKKDRTAYHESIPTIRDDIASLREAGYDISVREMNGVATYYKCRTGAGSPCPHPGDTGRT